MFNTSVYQNRRKKLIQGFNNEILLFPGNVEIGMNYKDNIYHFRQDSTFLYYFGIDQPNLVAWIDSSTQETILFGDELTIDHTIWTGAQPTLQSKAELVGIEKVLPLSQLFDFISKTKQKGIKISYLPTYHSITQLNLSLWLSIPHQRINNLASTKLIKRVVQQRSIKENREIFEMEEALRITKEMHIAAMKMTKPGVIEAEISAKIHAIALKYQAELAYPIIFSKDGQTLHNHYHGNTLKSGDFVLGDFGAENQMHYAGDITRSYPVDKKFTSKQKDIYNIVLKAEKDIINLIKPGIKYMDMHLHAAQIVLEGLKDLGIVKGNLNDALSEGVYGLFFPHGLGHMIGLDVHDMENLGENLVGYRDGLVRSDQFGLKYLRLGKELEIGNVITVEPGIYFIPELINKWESEKKCQSFINYSKLTEYFNFGGIRIEDNCLITKDGSKTLGTYIPKEINEIEDIKS